ncbi:MAG TPA: ABC transporter permease [Thermoplasmata archaeon]|nr:ABC transporter permease [Thermoplasmata archaeon]
MDVDRLPSDLEQWGTAVRRQLRFYLKTWRFLGLLLFVVIVGAASTVVTIYYHSSGTSASDAMYSGTTGIGIFGVIVGAFIGGDAIAMDFGSGTGYFMLVLPVRRVVLLLGRFAAAFLVSLALIGVFYAYTLLGAGWFYGLALPWLDTGASIGMAALFLLAILAVAFLFSSFFRSPAVSMVVTILVLFLGFDIVDGILVLTSIEPWFSILYAGGAIANIFESQPHLIVTQTMGPRGLSIHSWSPYVWEGIAIMVGYFVICLALSAFIYQRKESKG